MRDMIINSIFEQIDLNVAEHILTKFKEPKEFWDWVIQTSTDETLINIVKGQSDVVALVYEYLISRLDSSDPIIDEIQDYALDYLHYDGINTRIIFNLSDMFKFRNKLEFMVECEFNYSMEELLNIYFKDREIDPILIWVLKQMDIDLIEG